MRKSLASLLLLTPFILLQGCSTTPSQPWIESSYQPRPPLKLDVVSVDVEKNYIPPEEPPFVDHRFNTSPSDMIETWAKRYLQSAGRVGRAVLKIQEASVVEHIEERRRTESIPYTGKIELRLEFYGPDGEDQGASRAMVMRTNHIPLNISEPDRQRAWKAMIQDMFGALEPLLEKNIYENLPSKIVR